MMGLLALGLALATVGRAGAQETDSPGKVHGTITVDFDKVTISELLKLVSVVEKVDGTIHIVSAKVDGGEGSLIVSGSNGAIALTRPDQPAAPKVVIGPTRPAAPTVAAHPAPPSAARFAPLAAIGRLLGVGREPANEHVQASAPPTSGGPGVTPLEVATPGDMPRSLAPGSSAMTLDSGGLLGALADGEPVVVGPIHSPWPKPATTAKPKSDAEVSRAGAVQDDATAPPKHVVAKGDTFAGLARKYYGDARYSRALWWANRDRVAWPDALVEGKSLVVPGLGELEPRMVLAGPIHAVLPDLEPAGPRRDPHVERASHVEPEPAPGSPDSGGVAVHIVRPDDTLRIIAREKCGDERKALEIMALNRDALSKEGRPRVGQCLILPPPAAKP